MPLQSPVKLQANSLITPFNDIQLLQLSLSQLIDGAKTELPMLLGEQVALAGTILTELVKA